MTHETSAFNLFLSGHWKLNFKIFFFFLIGNLIYFYIFYLELESSKKQAEADKKAIDDLVRERDILNKVTTRFLPTSLFFVVFDDNLKYKLLILVCFYLQTTELT